MWRRVPRRARASRVGRGDSFKHVAFRNLSDQAIRLYMRHNNPANKIQKLKAQSSKHKTRRDKGPQSDKTFFISV